MMTDPTRLRRATYSGSAAASLDRFKTQYSALLALAAVFLASAAAKRSLTDMVRGWGRPNCQMCTFTSNKVLPVPSEPPRSAVPYLKDLSLYCDKENGMVEALDPSKKSPLQRHPLQSDMTVAYINFESGQQHDSLQYDAAH